MTERIDYDDIEKAVDEENKRFARAINDDIWEAIVNDALEIAAKNYRFNDGRERKYDQRFAPKPYDVVEIPVPPEGVLLETEHPYPFRTPDNDSAAGEQ